MDNGTYIHCLPYKKDKDRREGKGHTAATWWTELIQFLSKLAILHQYSIWRKRGIHPILHIVLVQFILFFTSSWCISSYSSNCPGAKKLARQGIKSRLLGGSSSRYDLCLLFCLYPFLFSMLSVMAAMAAVGRSVMSISLNHDSWRLFYQRRCWVIRSISKKRR